MPTIFSHAVFASAIGGVFRSARSVKLPARFWILTAVCPVLPDMDVVSFALGIPYNSLLGHRGITHSALFALFTGLIVSILFFSSTQLSLWTLALYFAAVTFTHPLLDMLTNGGLGVAVLAPFSNQRFFFPWRPIEVSPIGVGFFSERGLRVALSEILWIWLPSLVIATATFLIRKKRMKTQRTEISRT